MVSTSTLRLGEPRPIGESASIALDRLVPSKANRQVAKDDDLKGLAESIAAVGLLYPLIVRPDPEGADTYRIIAGERRYRALKRLKAELAPCVILNGGDEAPDPEILRVVENHQRKNLEPLEEAAAIRALLDSGLELETVARSLGRPRAWIARRSSLMDLSEAWIREIRDKESKIALWPPSHLESISRFPKEVQDRMLERWGETWRWSIPALQELTAATGQCLRLLDSAPWKQDDGTLDPTAGACVSCPKRSSYAPELFPDELFANGGKAISDDHCLDAACWQRKAQVFLTKRIEALRRDHSNLILLNAGEPQHRAPLAEAFQAEVFNAWDTAIGKKSAAGSVPALVVNGAGLGRIKWVVPTHDGPATPATRRLERIAYGNDNGNGASERTVEEKKAPYDRRRRQIVIDVIKEEVERLARVEDWQKLADEKGYALAGRGMLAKSLFLLRASLDERGWKDNVHAGAFMPPEEIPWQDLCDLKNHEIGTGEMRGAFLNLCWDLLRLALQGFAHRLLVAPGEKTNDFQFGDAQAMCRLLGLDFAALRAQAAQTIPYAKSWRDTVQDNWTGETNPENLGQPVPEESVAAG